VINLKKRKIIFEKKSLHVVVPLDSAEGSCYTKPMPDYESNDDLDCIYKITVQEHDWVNPTTDGRISRERESSSTSDSDEEIERWQNRLHEVTTLIYNMMTRSLHCVSMEIMDMHTCDGLSEVDAFINRFEGEVPEQ